MKAVNVLAVQDLDDGSYVTVYEQDIYRLMAITKDVSSKGLIQGRVAIAQPTWVLEPYSRAIVTLAAAWPRPRSITIMGHGVGAQFRSFRYDYPQAAIEVVERFSAVVDLAEKYFLASLSRQCRYHILDYIAYLNRPTHRHQDVVVVDILTYKSKIMEMANEDFFQLCNQMLSASGVLIVNLVGDLVEVETVFGAVGKVFARLFRYPVDDTPNTLLIASQVSPRGLLDWSVYEY